MKNYADKSDKIRHVKADIQTVWHITLGYYMGLAGELKNMVAKTEWNCCYRF